MKKMLVLIAASLFALIWAGAASADTYTPIQITSAGINASQQTLTLTWVTPPQGLSLTSVTWDLWDASTSTWGYYEDSAAGTVAPGSITWTLLQPQLPPADASATMSFAVQVSAWDTACTWDNNGILFYGCTNYSPWTYFNLTASCKQNLITPAHYVVKRRGHYIHVKRHHHRVRVWVKPVRVWVKAVYGSPTCAWVNS